MKTAKYMLFAIVVVSGVLLLYPSVYAQYRFRERVKKTLENRQKAHPALEDREFFVTHDGITRMYKVHVPPAYTKHKPIPVILAFHGGGGNAERSVDWFQLNSKADAEGFMVVYPEGTGKEVAGQVFGSWNAGECCPPAVVNNVDDVGFVSKMLDKLGKDFRIDKNRIFATGFSNGALICYRLACELSERIAAIAVGGAHDAFKQCNPSRHVPVLHFHGTNDNCGMYNGGTCGGCFADYLNNVGLPADRNASLWQCRSVPEYINEWRVRNGCSDPGSIMYQKGTATCVSYSQCAENAEVVLCTLEGSGHQWPGGGYGNKMCDRNPEGKACVEWLNIVGQVNRDLSANDMLWEFFKRHPKQQ